MVVKVARQRECTRCHRTVHLKMVKMVKCFAYFTTKKTQKIECITDSKGKYHFINK